MQQEHHEASLETLKDIRSIMDRSARFISLSGWSGVWAGCTALAGAWIAYGWMQQPEYSYVRSAINDGSFSYFDPVIVRYILLALAVFAVALAGGLYFTFRKARNDNQTLWNKASRQMVMQMFFPLFAGGVFAATFIYHGFAMLIAPACLVFYGLSLISASRYTLADIRYLGMLEVALGCTCIFFPGFGLYFWAAGFGVLHILYGAIMWNKYDK